jgi:Domain of unknown function (DUF5916)
MRFACVTACLLLACFVPRDAAAQPTLVGATLHITKATSRITIDGDLSDEAWQHATRIEKWYETQPGDNTEPKVKNVGYLTYDDRFFYAAFDFADPNIKALRAPFADRDNLGNGFDDYGGVIIDARATGSTATLFVVTPRNIQYDSNMDDSSGEDPSPDYFWDSATKINAHGWTLEMRIPFSSIRYKNVDPQTWRILLYRNYPRDRHYQFFSARLPRDTNCFICRSNVLTGLEHLPSGGHIVITPYVAGNSIAQADGPAGAPLGDAVPHGRAGVDVKYLPNADNALDLTVKPDFSQVESDTAQIATNQRFALFFPEKRPFFLEGVDMFATPIQAVYTRTITDPIMGGRLTGKAAGFRYTALLAEDDGGGSIVLPGATNSSFAPADFASTVFVGRAKRDMGLSFVSVLATDRENHDGNGYNRVVGPDVQWRPSGNDVVSGQVLFSATKTPNHPDLAPEWDGRSFNGYAIAAAWNHSTTHLDWYGQYRDFGDGFRADTGFVPQVGYRALTGSTGWTFRPKGFISRLRTFLNADEEVDTSGHLITRELVPGFGMDSKLNGFMQYRLINDHIRTPAGAVIGSNAFGYVLQFSPSHVLSQIGLDGRVGQDIDFANSRPAHSIALNTSATIRPTTHLELAFLENQQWLSVSPASGGWQRLFTARVSRVKGTYTFTSRTFVRAIAQYVSTTRDPLLYAFPVAPRSGDFGGSLLFAYKINWQSVMFVGYGDDRELTSVTSDRPQRLAPLDRQVFVKLSYAFQR